MTTHFDTIISQLRTKPLPSTVPELLSVMKPLGVRCQEDSNTIILTFLQYRRIRSIDEGVQLINRHFWRGNKSLQLIEQVMQQLVPHFEQIPLEPATNLPSKITTDPFLLQLQELSGEGTITAREFVMLEARNHLKMAPDSNHFIACYAQILGIQTLTGAVLVLDALDCRGDESWGHAKAIEAIVETILPKLEGRIEVAVQLVKSLYSDVVYPVHEPVLALFKQHLGTDHLEWESAREGAVRVEVNHQVDLAPF